MGGGNAKDEQDDAETADHSGRATARAKEHLAGAGGLMVVWGGVRGWRVMLLRQYGLATGSRLWLIQPTNRP